MYESLFGQALFADSESDKRAAMLAISLQASCQTAMFCACGSILDCRRSVYFETAAGRPVICCWSCADSLQESKPGFVDRLVQSGGSVVDGRLLRVRGLI